MGDILQNVKGLISGVTGVLMAFVVLIVFANILFTTGMDPIGGIVNLLDQFLNFKLTGLLALLVFAWLLND